MRDFLISEESRRVYFKASNLIPSALAVAKVDLIRVSLAGAIIFSKP